MCNDWEITHERQDLPPHVWQFIKDKGFLGMIIPKQYGGLGFSALAHSAVVMKLSTRSSTAAISVMVPNSLGPGELLLHYGTDEQKNHYLPRLAQGPGNPVLRAHQPRGGLRRRVDSRLRHRLQGHLAGQAKCSACASPGTSATSRSGPVATLLGLAFRLYDPEQLLGDKEDLGITCALIPTNTPGREHRPAPHAAQRRVPERPELRQGRVHAARLDHRRAANTRARAGGC